MIGIVLVTHGRLAEEFIAAAAHVVGDQQYLEAVCIDPKRDNGEQLREDIMQAVQRVDTGKGVMILTDMFGGMPSNLAISLMSHGRIEVVAGLNLPMLIRLLSIRRDTPLEKAALAVQEAGRKYINVASTLLDNEAQAANG